MKISKWCLSASILILLMGVLVTGCIDNLSDTPNEKPVAELKVDPSEAFTGQAISFIASTSTDPDGRIVEYKWDWENDGIDDVTSAQPVKFHSFNRSGLYNVRLTVEDDEGATSERSILILIWNRDPVITYAKANRTEALTFDEVEFIVEANDPDGNITSFIWDFNGDGEDDMVGTANEKFIHSYDIPGDYTPQLTIIDDEGAANSTYFELTILNREPELSLSTDLSQVLTHQEIRIDADFSDTDGEIIEMSWDLDGDGKSDFEGIKKSLSHQYKDDGNYTITVTVTDDQSGQCNRSLMVEVINRAPELILNVDSENALTYEEIELSVDAQDQDGYIAEILWDLDADGTWDITGKRKTTTQSYTDDGLYEIFVMIKDDDGAWDSASQILDIHNRPPTANPGLSLTQVSTNTDVTFYANAADMDGTVVKFQWDFQGDGSYDWTGYDNGDVINHYTTPGNYKPTLKITDDDGGYSVNSLDISVTNQPPSVSCSKSSGTVTNIDKVTLTGIATDSDGSIAKYEWDFTGDGIYDWSSMTAGTVDHQYSQAGNYKAVFKATDDSGQSDTCDISLLVSENQAPVSSPGASYSASLGSSVNFDGSASYDPDGHFITYSWDFDSTDGIGTDAAGSAPSFQYPSAGTFTATLTVSDGYLDHSATTQVTITSGGGGDIKKYAICIGISDYPGTWSDLEFADDDARDWENYLKGKGYTLIGAGQNHPNVPILNTQATKSNIIDAIRHLKGLEDSDDYVAITYSGHGIYQGGNSYWNDYSETDVSSNEIKNELAGFESQHIFVFVDCCECGDFDNDLAGAGRYIACACSISESTLDWNVDEAPNGAFTYHFLKEGLNMFNSVEQAYSHTRPEMINNYDLHPEVSDGVPGNFVL